MMAANTERMNRSSVQDHPDAFPFDTTNPSGVPGHSEITAPVVAAIAGHAAMRVDGVVKLGQTNILRTITSPLASTAAKKRAGVTVEAGSKEAIFDLEMTIRYGYNFPKVIKEVREEVAIEMKKQLGLVAKEINVKVTGIEFSDESRVS